MPAAEPRTSAVPDETVRRKAIAVRLMIFDVDGVLTDGRIIYHDDGSELKAYDVQDGHGIKLLLRAGLEVAFMSGRYCGAVARRAEGLGIRRVFQNIQHKAGAYAEIKEELGLRDAQVGYMGDDLIDIPVMRRVGFAVTVPNASPHVRPYAHYITRAAGGRGACREVCELLLHSQGLWESVTRRYFHDDFPSEV